MSFGGPIFSFDHNWKEPIVERLTWLTNVLTHRDNSEQRRQPRTYPRRQMEYAVLPETIIERQRLDNFIWSKQKGAMLLPIWTDASVLTVQADSGQPDVTVSTAFYDYDEGEYLILWRDFETYEAVQIDSLTSSVVMLAENLAATWPVGTIVAPARLARMSQSVQGQQYAHDIRPYRFQFDIDEASVSTNRITALSPDSYLSVDTFPNATEAAMFRILVISTFAPILIFRPAQLQLTAEQGRRLPCLCRTKKPLKTGRQFPIGGAF